MKLSFLYAQAVKFGKKYDPRPKGAISAYEDTAILYGSPDTQIRKILVGIDIDAAELLLADKIRQEEGLDLVISHHPEGRAWANFYQVMQLQVDMLEALGLARKAAQQFIDERKAEVARRVMPQNHTRSVDVARILKMPFMCVHTPADNHVYAYLKGLFKKEKPRQVRDIIKILSAISEYKTAARESTGPKITLGSPLRGVGKILLEMTGGTEGHSGVFAKIYPLGVRTLVSMHLGDEHFKKVKDANLNVVIAGHISSDTLGLNLLLDNIEKAAGEELEVVSCSGFRRFQRAHKRHN
ncbi:MAG: NGG1p interacting factor NIF3 [Candidatus Omnitrophota bacterium]